MTDQTISHEMIEEAFRPAAKIIERLPSTTETRRAAELLKQSEKYVFEARERVKAGEGGE